MAQEDNPADDQPIDLDAYEQFLYDSRAEAIKQGSIIKKTYLLELEITATDGPGSLPDDDKVRNVIMFSTAKEALSQALKCDVSLRLYKEQPR